jgi:hypothetical protein
MWMFLVVLATAVLGCSRSIVTNNVLVIIMMMRGERRCDGCPAAKPKLPITCFPSMAAEASIMIVVSSSRQWHDSWANPKSRITEFGMISPEQRPSNRSTPFFAHCMSDSSPKTGTPTNPNLRRHKFPVLNFVIAFRATLSTFHCFSAAFTANF